MALDELLQRQKNLSEKLTELGEIAYRRTLEFLRDITSKNPNITVYDPYTGSIVAYDGEILNFLTCHSIIEEEDKEEEWDPLRGFPDLGRKIVELSEEWYITSIKIIKSFLEKELRIPSPKTNIYLYSGNDVYWARIIGGNWDYVSYNWSFENPSGIRFIPGKGYKGSKKSGKEAIQTIQKKEMENGENYRIMWIKTYINERGILPKDMRRKYDLAVIDGNFPVWKLLRKGGVVIEKLHHGNSLFYQYNPESFFEKIEIKEWYVPDNIFFIVTEDTIPLKEGAVYPIVKPVIYVKTK